MSMLVRRLGKHRLVRRTSLLLSKGFSSSPSLQTPPCSIIGAKWCGDGLGRLTTISYANDSGIINLDKKVPMAVLYSHIHDNALVTIGSSNGWVATLTADDGILRLQDDLNPVASDTDPKRIPLPPLITLPHCQTQIVTNVSMSSSSPEDEDCVVAVKFLGPQLSFCRPAQSKSEWTNIRIENSCFYSSRVMFSKKDRMFCIPGSGGHLIGSWDLCEHSKLRMLRFKMLPKLTQTDRELLDSCVKTEHLVESPAGETFLVKWYKKAAQLVDGVVRMKTKELMVFKLDDKGNAVYTKDIGDLCIFLSNSELFCVPASSFPGLNANYAYILDVDEIAFLDLSGYPYISRLGIFPAPYHIPPQTVDY